MSKTQFAAKTLRVLSFSAVLLIIPELLLLVEGQLRFLVMAITFICAYCFYRCSTTLEQFGSSFGGDK